MHWMSHADLSNRSRRFIWGGDVGVVLFIHESQQGRGFQ